MNKYMCYLSSPDMLSGRTTPKVAWFTVYNFQSLIIHTHTQTHTRQTNWLLDHTSTFTAQNINHIPQLQKMHTDFSRKCQVIYRQNTALLYRTFTLHTKITPVHTPRATTKAMLWPSEINEQKWQQDSNYIYIGVHPNKIRGSESAAK